MIEVTVDSIRASLVSQHRVVVLREVNVERYLPIWIGPYEADAINIELQGMTTGRPLTHDLLKSIIDEVGARVSHILVSDLREDTFFACIALTLDGRLVEIDSRPSDAIALAVRTKAPIYVAESVMEKAGIVPEPDRSDLEQEEKLSAFRDFVNKLDLDD
jgi:bifunctional DNase/RNase